ncbi:MAG: LuxR C-terminal-related transcriptional regulator [Bdellovibrionia bacterium]
MVKEKETKFWPSGICQSGGDDLSADPKPRRTEILLVKVILIIVFLFALLDISEDISFHTPTSHLVTDISLTTVALLLLTLLLRKTKFAHWRANKLYSALFESKREAERSKTEAEQSKQQAEWAKELAIQSRQQAEQATLLAEHSKQLAEKSKIQAEQTLEDKRLLMKGLGQIIEAQLDKWNLSAAEKEIALLLLKGLSHAEIASVRSTSERTVRQQSLKVYAKAGLKGRSDLAAYFIEDMLGSIESRESQI